MPDSDAIRQRRRRAHAKGDHSLCGATCTAARVGRLAAGPPPPHIQSCTAAVDALGESLQLRPDDPRSVSLAVARKLAELVDAGEAPVMAAQQLVGITGTLAAEAEPGHRGDAIDEVRAKYHARLLAGLVARN